MVCFVSFWQAWVYIEHTERCLRDHCQIEINYALPKWLLFTHISYVYHMHYINDINDSFQPINIIFLSRFGSIQ